jgi:hypothetical protein
VNDDPEATPEPISIWLYLGGLCVTLSGLYAVNHSLGEPDFATMTYALAFLGYTLSYVLRSMRVSVQTLQVPALAALVLVFLSAVTSDQGLSWFAPPSVIQDRAKVLQMIFVYMALAHSFVLSSDGAVLFACVPCMTMLALVSTTNADPEVQNAFLVFVAASTFLTVHENYLRTRHTVQHRRTYMAERRLFTGQLQLAAVCVLGAFILAHVAEYPIRAVGQTVFTPTNMSSSAANMLKREHILTNQIQVSERTKIDIGSGPGSESDAELLHIKTDVAGLKWRGSTLDYYTGRMFESLNDTLKPITPADSTQAPPPGPGESPDVRTFAIPRSDLELPDGAMQHGRQVTQTVTVVGNSITSQIYSAGSAETVRGGMDTLSNNDAGAIEAGATLPANSSYTVRSEIPDDDPALLRKASSSPADVPTKIADTYLETHPQGRPDNVSLVRIAKEATSNAHNNYDRVMALKDYIDRVCVYDLNAPPAPASVDVVEDFLVTSHRGYCDRFAAALAILCRYARIPARLASGFLTGDPDKDGVYIVREKHKHLWTEVFFPNIGWVPFDATDGAQDVTVHRQLTKRHDTAFLAWLTSHGAVPLVCAGVVLLGLLYVVKVEVLDRIRIKKRRLAAKGRPLTNLDVMEAYVGAVSAIGRSGMKRTASQTPEEYLAFVRGETAAINPVLAQVLERLTNLHAQFLYGPGVATEEDADQAKQAQKKIESIAGVVVREARKAARARQAIASPANPAV